MQVEGWVSYRKYSHFLALSCKMVWSMATKVKEEKRLSITFTSKRNLGPQIEARKRNRGRHIERETASVTGT